MTMTRPARGRNTFKINPATQLEVDMTENIIPRSEKSCRDMMDSFKLFGQKQAVEVKRLKNGKYAPVFGYRRSRAAQMLVEQEGFEDFTLEVVMTDKSANDYDRFVSAVVENTEREDHTALDNAILIKRFKQVFQKSNKEIAKIFKKSEGWVSQQAKLLTLAETIQQEVRENCPQAPADLLYRIASLDTEEDQKAAWSDCIQVLDGKMKVDKKELAKIEQKDQTKNPKRRGKKAGLSYKILKEMIEDIQKDEYEDKEVEAKMHKFSESFLAMAEEKMSFDNWVRTVMIPLFEKK